MDEEALNMSIRKFLKKVGITSQREIEKAVRDAAEGCDMLLAEARQMDVDMEVLVGLIRRRGRHPDAHSRCL